MFLLTVILLTCNIILLNDSRIITGSLLQNKQVYWTFAQRLNIASTGIQEVNKDSTSKGTMGTSSIILSDTLVIWSDSLILYSIFT